MKDTKRFRSLLGQNRVSLAQNDKCWSRWEAYSSASSPVVTVRGGDISSDLKFSQDFPAHDLTVNDLKRFLLCPGVILSNCKKKKLCDWDNCKPTDVLCNIHDTCIVNDCYYEALDYFQTSYMKIFRSFYCRCIQALLKLTSIFQSITE